MRMIIKKDVPLSFINMFNSKMTYLYITRQKSKRLSLEYMRIDSSTTLYHAFDMTWNNR